MKTTLQMLAAIFICIAAIPIFCVVIPIIWVGDMIKLADDGLREIQKL
jgi:hypothetical protein